MMDWSNAFLEQAKSDLGAADILVAHEEHACQSTMLLQMAWEKLAKAALVTSAAWSPTDRTHRVIAKFLSVLKRAPQARPVLGSGTPAQFNARLNSLQNDLVRLEELTPALSQGINAEYPWKARDKSGDETVFWPAEHLARDFCAPGPVAKRVRVFCRSIIDNFDQIFQ